MKKMLSVLLVSTTTSVFAFPPVIPYTSNFVKTSSLQNSSPLTATVDRVIDGDTFQIFIQNHPKSLQHISVRVKGVDTPEIKGKCNEEKVAAQKANGYKIGMEELVEQAKNS